MNKLSDLYKKETMNGGTLTARKPLIISGPCSAETEAQVMQTARALQPLGISYFRAGIWKPRTSPDSFAGVGSAGLAWLQRVRTELDMPVATEVANAKHVEEALDHDIDMLWIGARTTVNPFAVQEIADALKGHDRPVMVKNPINPDLQLWIGAMERLLRAGVKEVIACHRGFNVYGEPVLRNAPLWEIPIELKRQFPELPLICDPSHIAGKRAYLREIARKALDLGYEGLMIEAHPEPSDAWSDPAQQVDPATLADILQDLSFRVSTIDDETYKRELSVLRDEIDQLDQRLGELLSERMELSRRIGALKRENNVAFYQYNRWNEILKNTSLNADKLHLRKDFLQKMFSLIHLESIDIQGE